MHLKNPDSLSSLAAASLGKVWKPTMLTLGLLAFCSSVASAQTTAFTYQGRLSNAGLPANGLYDVRFAVYDALGGGSLVGGPVTNASVLVTNGLFTTTLDVGNIFTGGPRWLEVSVRTNGAPNFNFLSPRQAINSTPYAIRAGSVADGVITASKLASGVGGNGQVLKINGAALAWGTDLNSGGTVTSVNSGSGLTGGPITTSGSLAIDTSIVPRLGSPNTFSASNIFSGVSTLNNPANQFVGTFSGNGAGLTNLTASSTNITLAGDVTGSAGATTVARIRGTAVSAAAPLANQLLRYNGSSWTPAPLSLGTDVSGTLAVANGGTGATTPAGARTAMGAAASGANSDISSITGLTTPLAATQGGSGLSSFTVGDLLYANSASTLARLADSASGNALLSGGIGVPPGWGKIGLGTHTTGMLTIPNGGTGASNAPAARAALGAASSGANTDITSLGGLTTPISAAQGGTGASSAPAARTALGAASSGANTDITSLGGLTTPISAAQGGTGASSAPAARTALGAASSGANTDITSLGGLTTPISAVQGGSGLSSYTVGDLLYANSPTTLARLADSSSGNALLSGGVGVPPGWGKVGLATHVTGVLSLPNGGTGAGTPAAARTNMGAAASGANNDITSLSGLTTPISPAQGGVGITSYALGDLLYASGSSTLSRRAAGAAGQVLTVAGGFPAWTNANAHNHFGQNWNAAAIDGLFVQNSSVADGSSALTGSSTATNIGTGAKYGVFGQSLSPNGVGVQGTAFGITGFSTGVGGESVSPDGTGVYGLGSAGSGTPIGVYGEALSTNGIGVYGLGSAVSGVPVGVYGVSSSPNGYGLYTPNRLFVGDVSFFADHISLQTSARLFANNGTFASPAISFTASPGAGLYSPGVNILGFSTAGVERMRIAADGKVGIGRVPTANLLEVGGEASKNVAGGWVANSDARIKTDVRSLTNALETIGQVRPVSFRYQPEYQQSHKGIADKEYINVIAQEFAKVFPDSVKDSGETFKGEPVLQVDTYPATMYAISAIQELHGLLKNRDAELAKLREQNANLEKRLSALEAASGFISKAAR